MTQLHGRGNRAVNEQFKTAQQKVGMQFCVVMASMLRINTGLQKPGSIIEGQLISNLKILEAALSKQDY